MVAQTSRGNITSGDYIARSDAAPGAFPLGFASDSLTETIDTTDQVILAGPYTYTLGQFGAGQAGLPIRPFTVTVECTFTGVSTVTTTHVLRDIDGDGRLAGFDGDTGTIDYDTGDVSVTFFEAPANNANGNGKPITVTYMTNFEQQAEIPKIVMRLTTKSVAARVWALKDTIGLEQSYQLRRRFGLIAEDEVAYKSIT